MAPRYLDDGNDATSTQADAIVTAINQIISTLSALNLTA